MIHRRWQQIKQRRAMITDFVYIRKQSYTA